MRRRLTDREKIILLIAIAVVLCIIPCRFIILPFLERNSELNHEINLAAVKLSKYKLLIKGGNELKNTYDKLNYSGSLPSAGEDILINAISELGEFVKLAGVRIVEVRPHEVQSIYSEKKIELELKFRGGVKECMKFIYNIECTPNLFLMRRLQINALENGQALEGLAVLNYD